MRKRIYLLMMAVVMVLAMAGCGKKTDTVPEGDVYVPTFTEIKSDLEWVDNVFTDGNKVHFLGSRYEYDETTFESKGYIVVSTYDIDTKESTKKEILLPENAYIGQIQKIDNGFAGVKNEYNTILDEDGNWLDSESKYYIVLFDNEFNEVGSMDLSEIAESIEEERGWFSMDSVVFGKDGSVIFSADSDIYYLDKDGKLAGKVEISTWVNDIVMTEDGRIVVFYYDDVNYDRVASILDLDKKELGTPLENLPSRNGNAIAANGGKLYVNSATSLYLYDIDTATAEEILNWINCDINTSNLAGLAALSDDKFMVITTTYDYSEEAGSSTTIEMATLVKTPAKDVKQKTTVSLAMFSLDYEVKEKVIKFNRTNPDYRISVKTYVDDNWSNYEEAMTQFTTDIGTGNVADIILCDTGSVDFKGLSTKKIFADLYELMAKDEEVTKETFVPGILKALEVDGKLYCIGSNFSIATIVGATADVGPDGSWTFDEMASLLKKYPDASLFQYGTKDYCMEVFLRYGMDAFYDPATGDCHFNSAEFIKLLELANTFPKEYEYTDEYQSLPGLLRSKQVLLNVVNLWGWDEYKLYGALYGEPVTYVGYPTNSGSGNIAVLNNTYAISSKSKNKDAAWAFVKSMVGYEAQNGRYYSSFPTNAKALDDMFNKAMEADNSYSWMYDDVEVTMGALTQAEVDEIKDMINSIGSVASYDEKLFNIISEEAQAYFEGQKSAEDVVAIIQSRAQNYIDENR